jgi:flagellum-specific peptidoglycan hydrolase FlgJ
LLHLAKHFIMKFYSRCLLPALIALVFNAQAQTDRKITREEYINTFKDIAISEMNRSGIPASISLAQGMLESDNGNSRLAIKANNHFGIKCHGWTGKEVYHDDDENDECFRKYKSAKESYKDHTDFLMNGSRYVFLFYLDQTDYKGWAKGLADAGYATNPTYASDLIRIIEENDLARYDKPQKKPRKREERAEKELAEVDQTMADRAEVKSNTEKLTGSTGSGVQKRKILTRNRINYIIVNKGDTYISLSEEFKLMPFELARYNEIERNVPLDSGQVLYIQPKRNQASVEFRTHTVKEGETMYQISQLYGIKLDVLYKKNLMQKGTEPAVGDVLFLRKQKKIEVPEKSPAEEPPKIEFEE